MNEAHSDPLMDSQLAFGLIEEDFTRLTQIGPAEFARIIREREKQLTQIDQHGGDDVRALMALSSESSIPPLDVMESWADRLARLHTLEVENEMIDEQNEKDRSKLNNQLRQEIEMSADTSIEAQLMRYKVQLAQEEAKK